MRRDGRRAILRRQMRPHLLAAALGPLLALAAGCGSPCKDLATRICDCQPVGTARDTCNQSVTNQIGTDPFKPTTDQQATCTALLAKCPDPTSDTTACDRLKTDAGKQACGLAVPVPAAAGDDAAQASPR
ncbi:MAG: hypothetical protein ACJ79R_14660 [Anaeromyxobacteraceae bacterium]